MHYAYSMLFLVSFILYLVFFGFCVYTYITLDIDGLVGVTGRWGMGDGGWEMGDGKWEVGNGR